MTKKQKNAKELTLSVHLIILLMVFITFVIWYIIFVPYYLKNDHSITNFYTITYCILWGSYTIAKLLLTSKEKYDGEVLFWATIISYTIFYGIYAPPFMIISFFQKIEQNAFLHIGLIVIIIEKIGRFYLSTKKINSGESTTEEIFQKS
jgi:hypothetical protein